MLPAITIPLDALIFGIAFPMVYFAYTLGRAIGRKIGAREAIDSVRVLSLEDLGLRQDELAPDRFECVEVPFVYPEGHPLAAPRNVITVPPPREIWA